MTEKEQLIRARLAILALATEVKNVSRACRLAGVSRTQFYAMKKAYEKYGQEGLAPRIRRKPVMPNRTPAVLEEEILRSTRGNPALSYVRLAGIMKSHGINVTATMIRYVWQRHGLSTRSIRLAWVRQSNGDAGRAKAQPHQYEMRAHALPVHGAAREKSHHRINAGREPFSVKASPVDWNYWARVVRESLTR